MTNQEAFNHSDLTPFMNLYLEARMTERRARLLARRLGIELHPMPGRIRRLGLTPEDAALFAAEAAREPEGLSVIKTAEILGVHRQRVYALLNKGLLARASDGTVSRNSINQRIEQIKAKEEIKRLRAERRAENS